MKITLIILAYVANVFLNRYLNKITYKYDRIIFIPGWFMSIIGTLGFLIIFLSMIEFKDNWFTGKHWKRKE